MKIGIVGGGQLGRMMALAAYPLGLDTVFLDQDAGTPGGQVAALIEGAWDDADGIARLADVSDVVTFDVENVPASAVRALPAGTVFLPPVDVLDVSQDRLSEKACFSSLGIEPVPHLAVDSREGLDAAIERLGLPAVLKTRRLGYDGRGQRILRTPADVDAAWDALGSAPLILEAFVNYSEEVSIIGVRSREGEIRCYPLSHNTHRDGILSHTVAPWDDPALHTSAVDALSRVLEHFNYVGVLTIEFFVVDGRLLANEMAPRVHNSGHWTIEGAVTSQFENHVRAIAGLPLGGTEARGHSAMINFLGAMPSAHDVLAIHGAHHHDYGKSPRPGRKLGHATVCHDDPATRDQALQAVLALTDR